jgi:hypothetical protein
MEAKKDTKLSVSQLASTMNNRFEHLLVSKDEAVLLSGQKTEKQRIYEDSEQAEARRELLFVEEVAIKNREELNEKQNLFLRQVEAEFHVSLINDLAEKIRDTSFVLKKVLGFDPVIGKLLDVLYTESCSISRLEAIILQIDWLESGLIKFTKQPKYRRVDTRGKAIVIETLRQALSFIGIESLRSLIPALIGKKALPPRSEMFPELNKHMWEYTLGTALTAQTVAEKEGGKWYLGYNIGMFSNIGRCAIAKMYLRSFDAKLREKIIEARKKNNPVQAKALAALLPSHKYLISLWNKFASQLTSDLVNQFKCRWLMIGIGLEDYTRIKEISYQDVKAKNLHPLTALLFRSQGYMQFKMMKANGLMSKQASMLYLRNFGIVSDDVVLLMKTNLSSLEIHIPEHQPPPKVITD